VFAEARAGTATTRAVRERINRRRMFAPFPDPAAGNPDLVKRVRVRSRASALRPDARAQSASSAFL
jgi:hypothetical protein